MKEEKKELEQSENYTAKSNNEIEEGSKTQKKKSKLLLIFLLLIIVVGGCYYYFKTNNTSKKQEKETVTGNKYQSEYRLTSNSLEPFDLYFLQLENSKENKIYSPLSIKYALEMLNEGTTGNSKEQISNIIGEYKANKYTNNENMSLANALFIKDQLKNTIKEDYINNLKNKYNAEVIYDPFTSPDNMNTWINNKTLKLIDNMLTQDDLGEDPRFLLVNALAIDMEWEDKFIHEGSKFVNYRHENFNWSGRNQVLKNNFDNNTQDIASLDVVASINNYDIVKTLGEDKIRETVGNEYKKYLTENEWERENILNGDTSEENLNKVANEYLDEYIKEINSNYGQVDYSTDMSIYVDDNIKVFAKDLKEYNGTTLQYVGIMPKNEELDTYIKNIKSTDINELINNTKEIKKENFKEGVVTKIVGYIPKFKFDYDLKLKEDLNNLGVTDVFEKSKANLTNLTSEEGVFIEKAAHKANIEFTEDGIKASATTVLAGGRGAGGFEYNYDVPVEEIDITFDKPYMFLIRDKDSGEVWFMGTVYKPLPWSEEPTKDKQY